MIGWTTSVAMQAALWAGFASPYQDAYDQAAKEGKPLLVLVGAEWCPGCQTMKNEMIPELRRGGGLKPVVFTTVDTDEKPELSQRLLRGASIPQLVLYTRTNNGWRRSQLTGVFEPDAIRQFIRKGLVATRAASDSRAARVTSQGDPGAAATAAQETTGEPSSGP